MELLKGGAAGNDSVCVCVCVCVCVVINPITPPCSALLSDVILLLLLFLDYKQLLMMRTAGNQLITECVLIVTCSFI